MRTPTITTTTQRVARQSAALAAQGQEDAVRDALLTHLQARRVLRGRPSLRATAGSGLAVRDELLAPLADLQTTAGRDVLAHHGATYRTCEDLPGLAVVTPGPEGTDSLRASLAVAGVRATDHNIVLLAPVMKGCGDERAAATTDRLPAFDTYVAGHR